MSKESGSWGGNSVSGDSGSDAEESGLSNNHEFRINQKNNDMRTIIMSLVLAVATMSGWAANDNKLKVKLDIVDFGDTVLVVHGGQTDTFVGKAGKIEFELTIDTIQEAYLVEPRLMLGDMEEPKIFHIPLVGGEEVRIWQTTSDRYDVDGTGFYADYHQVDLYNEKSSADLRTYSGKYREMLVDPSKSETEREKYYKEVYLPSYDRYQQALIDYVKAHPRQEAAVMLLNDIKDTDQMKETFTFFDPSVQQGRMRVLYDKWVADAEESLKLAALEQEAAKKQEAGIEAPLFTLNNLEGKPLALSSLRGKYVVLDFWGSWCVWCIKGFPQMKEYYAKYPGKFEILGIDCNDTQEKWKAAVKKHELPWLHVYCPDDATVLSDYGITGFPTKIIIGPDGKIVKTIVGEDPSFYTLLDELFGK